MNKYDAVIFDVDGTLLDTTEGILSAVSYTIKEHRLPPLSPDILRRFIGPPIQDSFQRFYGVTRREALALAATFRLQYKTRDLLKAKPYDGIFLLLEELKAMGMRLGIATYKRQDYAMELLAHFGFPSYITAIYGSDMEGRLTKKDIILKCQAELSTSKSAKMLMIGDSDNDASAARDAALDFLGVTYGFGFVSKEDVDRFPNIGCAHHVEEIKNFLL